MSVSSTAASSCSISVRDGAVLVIQPPHQERAIHLLQETTATRSELTLARSAPLAPCAARPASQLPVERVQARFANREMDAVRGTGSRFRSHTHLTAPLPRRQEAPARF